MKLIGLCKRFHSKVEWRSWREEAGESVPKLCGANKVDLLLLIGITALP